MTVVRLEPRRPRFPTTVSGEDLRRGLEERIDARLADEAEAAYAPSDVPDVLAPGLRVVFCGINPGRVSAAAHAHFANPRNDFWRLLHAARFTSRLYEPRGAVRAAEGGHRRHERGVPHDAGVGRPAAGGLRGIGGAARADRAGAAAGLDRLRRQGGVPRCVRRAARARRAGADARRHAALRASVDLAGERGGAVGRAAAAGSRSWPAALAGCRCGTACARSSSTTGGARCSSATATSTGVVGHAGRRAGAGRDRRADAAPRAARGVRPGGVRDRAVALDVRSPAARGARLRRRELIARTSSGCRRSRTRRSSTRAEGMPRAALVHGRRARDESPTRPRRSRRSLCASCSADAELSCASGS